MVKSHYEIIYTVKYTSNKSVGIHYYEYKVQKSVKINCIGILRK